MSWGYWMAEWKEASSHTQEMERWRAVAVITQLANGRTRMWAQAAVLLASRQSSQLCFSTNLSYCSHYWQSEHVLVGGWWTVSYFCEIKILMTREIFLDSYNLDTPLFLRLAYSKQKSDRPLSWSPVLHVSPLGLAMKWQFLSPTLLTFIKDDKTGMIILFFSVY